MSTSLPPPLPPPLTGDKNSNLFASIDMGTNSFKLLIVKADPSTSTSPSLFRPLLRRKESVLLGLDSTATISASSILRATASLRTFRSILLSRRVPPSHSRLVATAAVRHSANKSHFLRQIRKTLDLHVDVLSGADEARLTYLGVLQFHPLHNNTILTVDIGGGSTEFVVGCKGEILYSISLQLGHVTLTRTYLEVETMREHIRNVIFSTDLVSKIREYDIEKVIGSSGTIRKIEKAVYKGYNVVGVDGFQRDWSFGKEDLQRLVERLDSEEREKGGRMRRERFFRRRWSGFLIAGAVLLEEIFSSLGLERMEVSGYALGEGVITEMIQKVYEGHDLKAKAGI